MNKEYIEREAAVAFLENMAASRYLIQCFEDKEKFPAADVAPVVHGYWKPKYEMLSNKYETVPIATRFECSECGLTRNHEYNYCPNCGARMDGGNKNA